MDKQTHFCTLRDGRKLAYTIYGDKQGTPMFFFHGMPGTGHIARLAEPGAIKHGFKLIAPDRPGMGDSDYQPHRRLYHYAEDMRDFLDYLKLERCGIIGISGGSPYAFQCAHTLQERISLVVTLSGWMSYGRLEAAQIKIDPFFRAFGWCSRYAKPMVALLGWYLPWALKHRTDPLLNHIISRLAADDQRLLAEEKYRRIFQEDLQNAFKQHWRGAAKDGEIQFAKPGFEFAEIKQPVILLHGKQDNTAPFGFAEILLRQLLNIVASETPETAGHFCAIDAQDWIFTEIRKILPYS
jgi:pimeloyl-ACP methyl ester carboxylesterase